jgi:hypothetical protein
MMNTARLNITMPEDVYEILKGVENKSSYIAEAVRMKKGLEDKAKAKKALAAAYKAAAEEDYATYKEWEPTLKDGLDE